MTPFSFEEAPYGSCVTPSSQAYGTDVSLTPGLWLRSLYGQSNKKRPLPRREI